MLTSEIMKGTLDKEWTKDSRTTAESERIRNRLETDCMLLCGNDSHLFNIELSCQLFLEFFGLQ